MSNPKLQEILNKCSFVKRDKLQLSNLESADTSTMNGSMNGTESTKPKMVSLLKMPAKIGASGDASSEDASVKPQSEIEKFWFLKEMFPALSDEEIKMTLIRSDTLDKAESELTKLACDKVVKQHKKPKRMRVRMMSDSSNEDPTSPLKSPESIQLSKKQKLTADSPSSSAGTGSAVNSVRINIGGIPISISYPVKSSGNKFDNSIRPTNGVPSGLGRGKSQLVELGANHKEADCDDDYPSSDEEVVKSKSKREKILKFFNEATIDEVIHMPRCSEKKASLIISMRPFTDWEDIKTKFGSQRSIGSDALENCRELIEIRQVVMELMGHCERMSEQMSSHVNKLLKSDTSNELDTCHIKEQPSLVNPQLKLKSYQMIGINWLLLMYQQKVDGILADEMGLGKTSQSIAFLAYLLEQGNKGPHLIIVPSSTLDNWATELRRWCPAIQFIVYHGSIEERRQLRHQIFSEKDSYHVILSTYNVLTSNVDDKQIYKKIMFQYTILDEAHLLKNMLSLRYKNLSKIQSVRRLLLTGTPFQNDLVELMSLLCFVMPNIFVNKEAELKKMFASISKKTDMKSSSFEVERISHAKNIMKPFVLRRLKKDVLSEMPAKVNIVKKIPLSTAQADIYSGMASQLAQDYTKLGKMSALTDLRFTANHHLLLRRKYTDDKIREITKLLLTEPSHRECNEQYVIEDMSVMSDFELHNMCKEYKSIQKYALTDEDILTSGKFAYLDELLPNIKQKGEKMLIFTQYKLVLNILEDYLRIRGHSYLRLDGSTPVPERLVKSTDIRIERQSLCERLAMIDEFNADDELFIFILSTRAGGLGINLTSANHVVLHDIDWNPHNDRQAEDRCHRLGQEKTVTIYKLISENTVEAAMLAQADRKLDLEAQIQDGGSKDDNVDTVNMLKEALSMWSSKH